MHDISPKIILRKWPAHQDSGCMTPALHGWCHSRRGLLERVVVYIPLSVLYLHGDDQGSAQCKLGVGRS